MPSRPSLARTERKDAGTDTRPFVSILFVKAETNWSISPSRHLTDWKTEANAKVRARRPMIVGEAARVPPWPRKERCLPLPPLTERANHGITWDIMGGQGISWEER